MFFLEISKFFNIWEAYIFWLIYIILFKVSSSIFKLLNFFWVYFFNFFSNKRVFRYFKILISSKFLKFWLNNFKYFISFNISMVVIISLSTLKSILFSAAIKTFELIIKNIKIFLKFWFSLIYFLFICCKWKQSNRKK